MSADTPMFKGTVAAGATKYVSLPVWRGGCSGAYVAWLDATSNATITVEFTSFPSQAAPLETAGTYQWKDSGLTFTGPAASAAGALMINLENVRQRRGRIKIVATATTTLEIYEGANVA